MAEEDLIAQKRAQLSAAKRALLEKRVQRALTGAQSSQPDQHDRRPQIPPIDRTGKLPLSFGQQRLWFLDQLEPGNPFYNVASSWRLAGALDLIVLKRCIATIVARHEILRTTFAPVAGQPAQEIAPLLVVPLELLDLRALAAPEREPATLTLIRAHTRQPFDLARGPLIRAVVLRLDEHEHILDVEMHHIISDSWSFALFARELVSLYDAFAAGKPAPLPALPIQYADYAAWQRAWLQGDVLAAQLAYWKDRLGGTLPVLELPTDRPRPPAQSFQGAWHAFHLPKPLLDALTTLSRRADATLFMTLLAAFHTMLHRYTGQDDIVVGTPIATRSHHQLEGLIGFFVNTLALRVAVSSSATFLALLEQVREVTIGAYAHQDVPFEKLVEELHVERDMRHAPLFQVMFGLHNVPVAQLTLAGMTFSDFHTDTGTTTFDLAFSLIERPDGLSGWFSYNAELFDPPTMARLAGHFALLLEGIAAAPDRRLVDLPLVTAAEREQLLVAWNATATDFPRERCIHELFAAQAAHTPDAVALVFEGPTTDTETRRPGDRETGRPGDRETGRPGDTETRRSDSAHQLSPQSSVLSPACLTYAELDARANQLAHALHGLGIGPDTRVAIALERSAQLIVGLLGVLKAGGAYVPLDLSYPAERLAFMLDDAQAPVLLTQRHLEDSLPAHRAMCVYFDDLAALAAQPTSSPPNAATPDNLAYVIYTSGSTGRPKGVGVTHRGVVRLVQATDYARLTNRETFLQLAPISFDASTFEVWGSLLNGARLAIVPAGLPTLAELGATLEREQISTLWLTASLFHQMVETQLASLRPVRQLLAGGDVLSAAHVYKVLNALPDCRMINGYGPTENTTFTCCYTLPSGRAFGSAVPIGRPIANTQVYILDRQLQPVPIGVAGELYIGGDGLARGYLGRPDLTAARFVPNPFAADTETRRPGDTETRRHGDQETEGDSHHSAFCILHSAFATRLYRTGDLARYQPDGVIEFLGRLDDQVKLRGYRIELGEIETVLAQHPDVRACAVLAREDVPGDKRLVAYVVLRTELKGLSRAEPAITPDSVLSPQSSVLPALRAFLAERLPDYMVPPVFVLLDALPLTPSGKLDRRALPAPDQARSELEPSFVAPRTPVEAALAEIWAPILGRERVGIHDNFFELGGHSLLATQVMSHLYETLQIELPLRALFEAPTLAELAARVETVLGAGTVTQAAPITPVARAGELPLSFAQQRMWFLNQLEPDQSIYKIPAAVQLSGALDVTALARSLNAIAARHEPLRTTFESIDGRPFQVIAPALTVLLPIIDLHGLPAAERERVAGRLATVETERPFDLTRGPLVRPMLLRLDADEHVLILTMHHIVADGWSMGVLVRELTTLYSSFVAGQPATLPDLPIQYVDFAVWQRQWLHDAALAPQLAYWRQQLAGISALELPTDHPRPAAPTFPGATQPVLIDQRLTDQLAALSRREGVTLFMTVLAAFDVLLARYSGQSDIAVGTPIANRRSTAIEALIGFFVNTLVLRADLSGNPTARDLLKRVRELCLAAYAHQDLPFEKLVEALPFQREQSRQPLFQVFFALQKTPLQDAVFAGMSLRPLLIESETATFELALNLEETPDGLRGAFEFNTDLFDHATIAWMVRHFQTLLSGIAADPDQRLASLPLLTEDERVQLLTAGQGVRDQAVAGRSTRAGVEHQTPDARLLHQLVAAQAARAPDAVALVCGAEQLTYQALKARADQLACYLRGCGVGADVLVGLCVERSLDLVVGLLGILTAGGAYVPLDPTYPPERLAFILEDAGAAVVVTQQAIYDLQVTIDDLPHTVCLDTDWPQIEAASTTAPVEQPAPDHLAYVIYTSGSTGTPKGAMVSHANVTRLFAATENQLDFDARDVWTLFHSFAFDFSVWEIWGALLYGGRLVVVPYWVSRSPASFYELLHAERVTVLNQTPSAFRQLMQADLAASGTQALALRLVIFGGEALDLHSLAPWVARHGDQRPRLVNMYGITETTVHVTYRSLAEADLGRAAASLIGRPLADLQTYVLDQQFQLQPIGVPGELFVGGAGLARGYLNQPELTAERFIPNPFAGDRETRRPGDQETRSDSHHSAFCILHSAFGTRLYRTGDRVRYRADGELEYLGRIDQQVKIRGFRIELGEIAAALSQHPAVQECAVVAREDTPGERRLVGYIVLRTEAKGLSEAGTTPTQSSALSPQSSVLGDLRAFLAKRLPDYMLPATFVTLDALPLTPNAKLDYRALPAPDRSRPQLVQPYAAPGTPVEEQLTAIWRELLDVDRVGIYDNFFELGGHSLLLTQLASRIRSTFNVNLPLRVLFDAPSVVEMTVAIADMQVEQEDTAAIDQLLQELDQLSPDEIAALLSAESL